MDLNRDNSSDSDSSKKFEKRFLYLLDEDMNCDCEFSVGSQNTIIRGHKLLFSAASEVFHAMFYGGIKEEKTVRVEDLDPEVFQGMRQFIYTGEVNFTSAIQALSMYIAARKYIILALRERCISFIQEKNIQPSEVLEFYDICQIHKVSEFNELCNKVIQQKTEKVVESEYFLSAGPETIELILKSPSLNFKCEIDVFHHFERWVMAEAERKGIDIGKIMSGSIDHLKKHIRFLTISSDDFVSKVAGSLLLTPEEKLAVACNLKKSDSKPMPESLSQEWQLRNFISSSIVPESSYRYKHVFSVSIDDPNASWCGEYNLNIGDNFKSMAKPSCKISWTKVLEYICFEVFIQPNNTKNHRPTIKLITIKLKLEVLAGKRCHPLFENNLYVIPELSTNSTWRMGFAKIPKRQLRNGCFSIDTENPNIVTILCAFTILCEFNDGSSSII